MPTYEPSGGTSHCLVMLASYLSNEQLGAIVLKVHCHFLQATALCLSLAISQLHCTAQRLWSHHPGQAMLHLSSRSLRRAQWPTNDSSQKD
jgi:hypothetical protein